MERHGASFLRQTSGQRSFILVAHLLRGNFLLRCSKLDDVGLGPGLLHSLQELQGRNIFASFINICQVAGRPVRLSLWPVRYVQLDWSEQTVAFLGSLMVRIRPPVKQSGHRFSIIHRHLVFGRPREGKSTLQSVCDAAESRGNEGVYDPTSVCESNLIVD